MELMLIIILAGGIIIGIGAVFAFKAGFGWGLLYTVAVCIGAGAVWKNRKQLIEQTTGKPHGISYIE